MKNIEEYIRQNRTALDHIEEPEMDAIWGSIQQQLKSNQNKRKELKVSYRRMSWIIGMVASLAFLLGVGLTLWHTSSTSSFYTSTPLTAISEDLAPMEQEFQQTIKAKQESIGFNQIDKNIYKEIFLELQQLESLHREYIQDIPAFREKDQLVKTLIKYYERKIRILERLNREIEKKEYYEKERKS